MLIKRENVILYSGLILSSFYLQWSIFKNFIHFLKGTKYKRIKRLKNKYSEQLIIDVLKEYKRELFRIFSLITENSKIKKEKYSRLNSQINYNYRIFNSFIQQNYKKLRYIDNKILKKFEIKNKNELDLIVKEYSKNNFQIEVLLNYFNETLENCLKGIDLKNEIVIPYDFYQWDLFEIYKENKINSYEYLIKFFIKLKESKNLDYDENDNLVLNKEINNNIIKIIEKNNINYIISKNKLNQSEFEYFFNSYYDILLNDKLNNDDKFRSVYDLLERKIKDFKNELFKKNADFEKLKIELNDIFLPDIIEEELISVKSQELKIEDIKSLKNKVELEKEENKSINKNFQNNNQN